MAIQAFFEDGTRDPRQGPTGVSAGPDLALRITADNLQGMATDMSPIEILGDLIRTMEEEIPGISDPDRHPEKGELRRRSFALSLVIYNGGTEENLPIPDVTLIFRVRFSCDHLLEKKYKKTLKIFLLTLR